MCISLRGGERIYVNGAVLRVDRKVTLELINDVAFLLESQVMQVAGRDVLFFGGATTLPPTVLGYAYRPETNVWSQLPVIPGSTLPH